MSFISTRVGQFTYFDLCLGMPDWRSKKVLDFGGNIGNLLTTGSTIDPRNYWCIDVSRDAIEQGRAAHPEAHFVFYDRYNWAFNPTGTEDLPVPDPGPRFDVIVAYSVFTHTNQRETRELVSQLRQLLVPGGTIAFTFIDANYRQSQQPGDGYFDGTNLDWRLAKAKRLHPGPRAARRLAGGGSGGAPGRGLGCGPADRHRGDGGRGAEEGERAADAGRRHARHGLLSRPTP